MPLTLVDGLPASFVAADDRGFAYGDGVFRTLAVRAGRALWWPRHYARLAADCAALGIEVPAEADLAADLGRVAAMDADCAVRITVTRGSGGRGYGPPKVPQSRRVVTSSPLPQYPPAWASLGVAVRLCGLRLAAQPRLAGIKHLNRLENVLARAEWDDAQIAEGLMLDGNGHVIEGTRCNLFIVEDGALATPELSDCGVAGVTRELVMEAALRNGFNCRSGAIDVARLRRAQEVFLVNSLIRVWPVAVLEKRHWSHFPVASLVRKWLDDFDSAPA